MKDKLTDREKKWEKAVGEGERKKNKNRKEEDGQAAVGGEKKQEGK